MSRERDDGPGPGDGAPRSGLAPSVEAALRPHRAQRHRATVDDVGSTPPGSGNAMPVAGAPPAEKARRGRRHKKDHRTIRRRLVTLLQRRWRPWVAGLFVNGAGLGTSRVLPTQWVAGLVVIAFGVAVFVVAAAGHSPSGRRRPWPDALLASAVAVLITTVALAVAVRVIDVAAELLNSPLLEP